MGVEGVYFNARENRYIKIVNSVMDGNDMIYIEENGAQLSGNDLQNYIKMEDMSDVPPIDDVIPFDNTTPYADVDLESIRKSFPANNVPQELPVKKEEPKKKFPHEKEMKDFFERTKTLINSEPEVHVKITWDNFPTAQLDTIKDFLGIGDEINEYIKEVVLKPMIDDAITQGLDEFIKSANK